MAGNKLKIVIVLLCWASSVFSQDLHFSQFNETPVLVNPALTGAGGSFRASVINKDQWKSVTNAYKTYGANIEKRFNFGGGKNKRRSSTLKESSLSGINGGLSFFSDKAGDGMLATNRVNLSIASFVKLDKSNFISAGIQGSYIQRRMDYNNFLFPNQYNGAVYDPNQASKEYFVKERYNYFDAATGLVWSFVNDQKNFDIRKQFTSHFGVSLYHVTKPKDQFLTTENSGYMKFIMHGDLIKSLGNSNLAISPSFLYQVQGPSKEFLIGALLRHYFKGNSKYTGLNRANSFGYGFYYRNKDALIFSSLIELQERFAIIFGYDINVSSLKEASSRKGGFEIGLRYSAAKSSIHQRK